MAKKKKGARRQKNDGLILGIAIGAAATYLLMRNSADCSACTQPPPTLPRSTQVPKKQKMQPRVGNFFIVQPRATMLQRLGVYRGV